MGNSFHASADAAFDAVATPTDLDGVGPAQIELARIWSGRGSYGCEHHLYVAAMRRVSAILFAAPVTA
jgi:hypothetical protein